MYKKKLLSKKERLPQKRRLSPLAIKYFRKEKLKKSQDELSNKKKIAFRGLEGEMRSI